MSTKAIYDYLASAGEKIPDYDTFSQKMSNPEYVETVRNFMAESGEKVPDSATFYQKYSYSGSQKEVQPPQAPPQPAPEPTWSEVLFPGAVESVQEGQPWWKQSGMTLGDLASLPGRFVGGVAEGIGANVGSAIYGGEKDEGEKAIKRSMAMGMQDDPSMGVGYNLAHGVMADPTLIPAAVTGAGIAKIPAITKPALAGKALLGMGSSLGLGAASRSYDPEGKVGDKVGIAIDAATGLVPAVSDIIQYVKLKNAGKEASKDIMPYAVEGMTPYEVGEAVAGVRGTPSDIARGRSLNRAPEAVVDMALPIDDIMDDIKGNMVPSTKENAFYYDKALKSISNVIEEYKAVNGGSLAFEDALPIQKILAGKAPKGGPKREIYDDAIQRLSEWRKDAGVPVTASFGKELIEDYAIRHPEKAKASLLNAGKQIMNARAGDALSTVGEVILDATKGVRPGAATSVGAAIARNLGRSLTQGDYDAATAILAKDPKDRSYRESKWLAAKGM